MITDKTEKGWASQCKTCGWFTDGWPTKKNATDRMKQHKDEHDSGKSMPELVEFLKENGLTE